MLHSSSEERAQETRKLLEQMDADGNRSIDKAERTALFSILEGQLKLAVASIAKSRAASWHSGENIGMQVFNPLHDEDEDDEVFRWFGICDGGGPR